MKWDQGKINEVNLISKKNQSVSVIYENEIFDFKLEKDKPFIFKF